MMKKNREGLTLITLVITIIVLLILATVSISLVVGDNGIINKAKNAKTETRNADEKEKVELAVASAKTLGEGELTEENLNAELERYFEGGVLTEIENEDEEDNDNDEISIVNLPNGFHQVEYIESTGTQYIDTKIIPDTNFGFYVDFYFDAELSTSVPSGKILGTSKRNRGYWGGVEFGTYPSNPGGQLTWFRSNYFYDPLLETKTRIQAQILNNIYTNSINNKSVTCNKISNSEVYGSLYLFAIHDDTSENNALITASNVKIYNFKAYNNSEIIQNLIPCYCTTTVTDVNNKECLSGTIGMYDTVEGKFYTNQGTGEFNKGKDVVEKTEEKSNEWIYEIDNRKYTISNTGKVEKLETEKEQENIAGGNWTTEDFSLSGNYSNNGIKTFTWTCPEGVSRIKYEASYYASQNDCFCDCYINNTSLWGPRAYVGYHTTENQSGYYTVTPGTTYTFEFRVWRVDNVICTSNPINLTLSWGSDI